MNKVSIIMPLYNNKRYVEKAINSVLKQTYINWELIIINDKSTDGVSKILEKYKNNNKITIITNLKNRGCYISLNKGIKIATGKYIARLDSDDNIHKDKLKIQVEILDQHPNVNIVFCRCKSYNKIIYRCMATALIKKEVFHKIGYYDSVRIAADSEFRDRYFKVYGRNHIHRLSAIMYYIRERPNSLSRHPETGMNSIVRSIYKKNYRKWHINNKSLYIEFPLKVRKFTAPKKIT